jgi:hypothetical protein
VDFHRRAPQPQMDPLTQNVSPPASNSL